MCAKLCIFAAALALLLLKACAEDSSSPLPIPEFAQQYLREFQQELDSQKAYNAIPSREHSHRDPREDQLRLQILREILKALRESREQRDAYYYPPTAVDRYNPRYAFNYDSRDKEYIYGAPAVDYHLKRYQEPLEDVIRAQLKSSTPSPFYPRTFSSLSSLLPTPPPPSDAYLVQTTPLSYLPPAPTTEITVLHSHAHKHDHAHLHKHESNSDKNKQQPRVLKYISSLH